jgi:hypothetical protein
VRDSKGKKADKLVVRTDPAVVSPLAELRGHDRQAAEEVERRMPASRNASPSTRRRRRLRSPCC